MKFGLTLENITKINSVFQKYPEIQEVIIYGSRAKGTFKPESDIDLTIKGPDLSYDQLNKISLEMDDLLLPYMMDISKLQQIENPDLIEHINRVGKVFYKKQ